MKKKIITILLAAALAPTTTCLGNEIQTININPEENVENGSYTVEAVPDELLEGQVTVTQLDENFDDSAFVESSPYSFLGISFDTPEELQSAIDDNKVFVAADGGVDPDQKEDESHEANAGFDFGYVRFLLVPEEQQSRIPWTDSPDAITDGAEAMEWMENETVPLGYISVFSTSYMEGKELEDITGMENNTEVGQAGDYHFYFSTDEPEAEMSEEIRALKESLADDMEALIQSLVVSEPQSMMMSADVTADDGTKLDNVGTFSTVDLDGNEVTNDIFKDYDLTILNVWTTFCSPCIEEMPHLSELSEKMKDQGVQVIGIVNDVVDPKTGEANQEMLELAGAIQERTKVSYPTILPNAELTEGLLNGVMVYPTTFFVDKEGKIVGEAIMGAMTKEDWEMTITETLAAVKE